MHVLLNELIYHSYVYNMTSKINESKTLIKPISCNYRCRFDSKKINLNQHVKGISGLFFMK